MVSFGEVCMDGLDGRSGDDSLWFFSSNREARIGICGVFDSINWCWCNIKT